MAAMAVGPQVSTISSTENSTLQPPPSSHRLPTQSAAAALDDLENSKSAATSSGLKSLDRALVWNASALPGGFERGKVTEIWGPSGAGKTAVAFQAAAEAFKTDGHVVWIDCATMITASRLGAIRDYHSSLPQIEHSGQSSLDRFRCLSVSTLSHLLALILHPPASFVTDETALLVIDDLNTLVDFDYPRMPFNYGGRSEQQKWQAGRRYAILGSIVTALNKLSVLKRMAVVVCTGNSSRMRTDDGLSAAMGPGVGGTEWESGIWSRIVVFRDFNGRFLGVQKCQGRNLMPLDPVGDVRNALRFEMTINGMLREHTIDRTSSQPGEVAFQQARTKTASSPAKVTRKRTIDEVADSEDEEFDEYGWAEADNDAAAEASEHKDVVAEQDLQHQHT